MNRTEISRDYEKEKDYIKDLIVEFWDKGEIARKIPFNPKLLDMP